MSTWILLRGLIRETGHWGRFPQQLAGELPEARIIALELPGNGELNGLSSPDHIEAMAAHCRAELAHRGIPPPYHLLAMSMGAMVATAWAQGHPEEIGACVLINTSFGGISPLHRRFRPRAMGILLRYLLARTAEGRERLIFSLTSRLPEPPASLIQEWVAIRQSRPVRLANAFRQLLAAARFRAPSAPPVRTLLLSSGGDCLADPRCSRDIARRWHCDLTIHASAGHDLPLDDGPWVAKEIHRWLETTPAS